MVVLGLVLIVLGALAIVSAVFSLDISGDHLRLLHHLNLSPLGLFLLGVASALAVVWGFAIFRWGAKRSWARRREAKRMGKLADSVESVESKRHDEVDQDVRDAEKDDRRTL
jgi:hypothetical protein